MKKMIITAVAVAFAAVVQAATVNWSTPKGYLYDGNGADAAKITSGSAYLMFVTGDFAQSDLVSAFAATNGDTTQTMAAMAQSGALATGAGEIAGNARLAGTSLYALSSDMDAYFVVFANEKMFISETASMMYDPVGQEATGAFASITASSKLSFDATSGDQGAGWYSAAAVPEPTSALMLLLGMAGLALKRKVA